MDEPIISDGLRLHAHLAWPDRAAVRVPVLVLCHGFPTGPRGAATSAATYPELADRIARQAGWGALAFNLRGTGTSEGDFSVGGWLADLRAAVDRICCRGDVAGVWLAGFREGGTLAVCEAASDERVRGVAALGAPLSLREWARDQRRLVEHARRIGMIRTPGFPADPTSWGAPIASLDAEMAARGLPPRDLLVVYGSDDATVPLSDARRLADAAGASAELRVVPSAGTRLRHDPRVIAVLLGWLDRQST